MSEDEPEDFLCDSCDFRFNVIWHNDAWSMERFAKRMPVIEYCPRCGSELAEQNQ